MEQVKTQKFNIGDLNPAKYNPRKGLYHKNEFRRSFIRQDLDRLTKEFRKLAKAAGDDERYER